jgi:hypothetical protein
MHISKKEDKYEDGGHEGEGDDDEEDVGDCADKYLCE